ncbi:helix-turn-helix transcriptional regulator [Neptuniibacter sp. PT8_73]|uniref:helix-turn-helix transcriptional regulator n=1 Tax=Neptuniibacter sp. PT8_73 TaxID=3398206 RepID=UPI0039F58E87
MSELHTNEGKKDSPVHNKDDSITGQLEGRCTFTDLDLQLQVHTNDTVERSTAQASFMVPPTMTVALILEGDLDAALDEQPLVMTSRNGPAGYIWFHTKEVRLDRWIRAGQRVRKVTVSLSLDRCSKLFDMSEFYKSIDFDCHKQNMSILQWQPTPQTLRCAEEILQKEQEGTNLEKLDSIISAFSLFRQAFAHFKEPSAQSNFDKVNAREIGRARIAREYILGHIDDALNMNDVANNTGMSVSTLQRTFKNCYGCTVMEFVRIRKLELARLSLLDHGITVGEAAFNAGYSSTANFSTAFQREFGYPPSSCMSN